MGYFNDFGIINMNYFQFFSKKNATSEMISTNYAAVGSRQSASEELTDWTQPIRRPITC